MTENDTIIQKVQLSYEAHFYPSEMLSMEKVGIRLTEKQIIYTEKPFTTRTSQPLHLYKKPHTYVAAEKLCGYAI